MSYDWRSGYGFLGLIFLIMGLCALGYMLSCGIDLYNGATCK